MTMNARRNFDPQTVSIKWDGTILQVGDAKMVLAEIRPCKAALIDFLIKVPHNRASKIEVGRAVYGPHLNDIYVGHRAQQLMCRTRKMLCERFGNHLKWFHYNNRGDYSLLHGYKLDIELMQGWRKTYDQGGGSRIDKIGGGLSVVGDETKAQA